MTGSLYFLYETHGKEDKRQPAQADTDRNGNGSCRYEHQRHNRCQTTKQYEKLYYLLIKIQSESKSRQISTRRSYSNSHHSHRQTGASYY